jgi:hypothetical protein
MQQTIETTMRSSLCYGVVGQRIDLIVSTPRASLTRLIHCPWPSDGFHWTRRAPASWLQVGKLSKDSDRSISCCNTVLKGDRG